MGYEMEFCKASRQELIFIAKIVCVMLEKKQFTKECPVGGVEHLAMN